jgi:hypothetical protein
VVVQTSTGTAHAIVYTVFEVAGGHGYSMTVSYSCEVIAGFSLCMSAAFVLWRLKLDSVYTTHAMR